MHVILAVCCLITGTVHSTTGTPLAGAQIVARGAAVVQTASDAHGAFSISAPPGSYQLGVSASGYSPVSLLLNTTHDVVVNVDLEPLDSPKLRMIGRATVDGRLTPIQGAIPSIDLTRSTFDILGENLMIAGLQALPGATFTRPDGGASSAIAVVSLRGPDPSESLITLDGQQLNDGNTGDLDLSRFPVAGFSSVNVTEGLGPEDTNGSNTFGGAINFVSLQPTFEPHTSFSLSGGSFGQSEGWINSTGTNGHLGYAFAVDDQNEAGYVNQTVPLYSSINPACQPCATHLGSSLASHLGLGTVTWTFSQDADITARVFLLGDVRDQSAAINGIDGDVGSPTYGDFIGPGNQSFAQDIRAFQIRSRAPLGAGELTTDLSESDNDISLNGAVSNPAYDITHVDHRYNGDMVWQRTFDTSEFAVGGYTRYESLDFPPDGPLLGQTINVFYARGGLQPTKKLRLDAGVFESHYTSFGANLDGRFGAIYNTDPRTALRFSLGTGFRAPLLFERYQFPLDELAQDANGVFIGQGSPNEHPEHATEYELGMSHEFDASTLDFSLYDTNLRDPIEIYYPLALAASGACLGQTPASPVPGCVSFNSNVGNAVYQGAEVRYVQRFAQQHLFLSAMYGLNVAYPKDLNADFSNPTSGGSLVDYRQFLGIPQQQGSLELDWANNGWHAASQVIFRGNNNELNLAPFSIVDALVGKQIGAHLDFSIAGTNLFSSASGKFTVFGAGVPYLGVDSTELPTNAEYLEPAGVRAIVTVKE